MDVLVVLCCWQSLLPTLCHRRREAWSLQRILDSTPRYLNVLKDPLAAVFVRHPSQRMTPTRRSGRHAVADDGRTNTDEDSLANAMWHKAAQNLDNQGTSSSLKSFLSFSNTSIISKLNNVGVSLGNNENDISVSTNALRHLEYDRLKVTPRVFSKSFTSHLDEEELHATSDGQLLAHVVGEVSDVGLEEPGLVH